MAKHSKGSKGNQKKRSTSEAGDSCFD
jgi:hypothetical protein